MFLKKIAKLTESYICWPLFFNKIEGWKETLVHVDSCEFYEMFKNDYLLVHVGTAASYILGYPYVGISSTSSTWKKCTVFSSILLFIYFKLILESSTTSVVCLEPYQTSMMQKRSIKVLNTSLQPILKYFSTFLTFFVWILE